LSTMERVGLVKLKRNGRKISPEVVATDFTVEFGISTASAADSNK